MIIALDYDDTYTRDPMLWDLFVKSAEERGHEVIIVTMRYPEEGVLIKNYITDKTPDVIYTSRQAKEPYCLDRGVNIDIWIDDKPHWILFNG